MPKWNYEQGVAVIHSPKGGLEEKDWLQHKNYLDTQAFRLNLQVVHFELGHIRHDLKYFSTEECEYLLRIAEFIRSDKCRFVWFASNGVSEAVRGLIRISFQCGKPRSYMGLRNGRQVKRLLDWYRFVEKARNLPIKYRA